MWIELLALAGVAFQPAWQSPSYSKTGAFHERPVSIGNDRWRLPGTLTVPSGKGPFPALVLVHGPGPNDRDETMYATKMFRDIAEGLASRGIAVLRYDKRTKIYRAEMSAMDYTLQQETIDDAMRAIALLRTEPEVRPERTFVLGHSLGGYAVPRIAAGDRKFAGAVILAGNARPIEDVVLDQSEYMLRLTGAPPERLKRMEALRAEVAKVKALAPGKNNPPVVLGLPAAYYLDLKGYDPVAEAKRLLIPLLILQGERDIQVTMKDFRRWKAASRDEETARSGAIQDSTICSSAAKALALRPNIAGPGNVAPEMIEELASWIAAR